MSKRKQQKAKKQYITVIHLQLCCDITATVVNLDIF